MIPTRKLKNNQDSPTKTNNSIGELIAELLHGATKTHMAHLKTTSFAAHMALGGFYEEIPGLADAVAEQYQGVTENFLSYPDVSIKSINTPEEAVVYLRELYIKVQKVQDQCMYSEIINELDVIKSLINSTKYKLIFLK